VLNAVGGACFAGFLIASLAVFLAERAAAPASRRQAAIGLLRGYVLVVALFAGLAQRDLCPFSSWKLAAGRVAPEVVRVRVVGVDDEGREHPVDARAWQPLAYDELMPWLQLVFPTLEARARERVAAYLLERAEAARARARAGAGVGYFDRFLGPLTAPSFVLHPRLWPAASSAPARPFVRVRLYREAWSLEERRRDPRVFRRTLDFEYATP
jgi:hypothetical protein